MSGDASDEPGDARRVINIFDRQPVDQVDQVVGSTTDGSTKPNVDPDTVTMLEEMLAKARDGKITGVVIIAGAGSPDHLLVDVEYAFSTTVLDDLTLFIGGLERTKHDLLRIDDDAYDDD